jgi:hypothetical protein
LIFQTFLLPRANRRPPASDPGLDEPAMVAAQKIEGWQARTTKPPCDGS